MLENERQLAAGEGETSWFKRIAEIDIKQERLLDPHLDGDITTEQFRAKSAELEGARVAAEAQLEAARSRHAHLKDIERGKDALISHYASLVPRVLPGPSSEEKTAFTRRCASTSSPSATAPLLPSRLMMSCLYLDGVPYLQQTPSGFVPCFPVMVAKT